MPDLMSNVCYWVWYIFDLQQDSWRKTGPHRKKWAAAESSNIEFWCISSQAQSKKMYRKEALAEVVSLPKDAGMVKSPSDNPSCCGANGNNKSTPLTANQADGRRWRLWSLGGSDPWRTLVGTGGSLLNTRRVTRSVGVDGVRAEQVKCCCWTSRGRNRYCPPGTKDSPQGPDGAV